MNTYLGYSGKTHTTKFRAGDAVRPSRAGGAGKAFQIDGFLENATGALFAHIVHPITKKGMGCFPVRSLRKLTAEEWESWKQNYAAIAKAQEGHRHD